MKSPRSLSALLTDLYELTMARGYWKSGLAGTEAAFYLSFRQAPFGSGFTVAAGLDSAIEFLCEFRFDEPALAYLSTIPAGASGRLFDGEFLDYLKGLRFTCDVDAVPEGTVVFPHEPLLRVQGPLIEAQLVETALLNFINFQSLIATKAARVCLATQGDRVIEFGLRRAQGPDGGLSASRAAYIGGCAATSNVLAGKVFGIPVSGTHAHSWVLAFEDELAAFKAYAQAFPDKPILLVDTYDSLDGVRHAIEIGRELRRQGHELGGVRLDSGDLAYLSIQARELLDKAGFKDVAIVASNDLDEKIIISLKQQKAAINVWGVGTRLVTGHDQPALGGVYKLSALKDSGGQWRPRIKLSEQTVKINHPGLLQVRRFRSHKEFVGDAIYDVSRPLADTATIVDPTDPNRRKNFGPEVAREELLVPILRSGEVVYASPPLSAIRQRVQDQLAMLHPGVKRLVNPHQYPAGLELSLHELKTRMILEARAQLGAGRVGPPRPR